MNLYILQYGIKESSEGVNRGSSLWKTSKLSTVAKIGNFSPLLFKGLCISFTAATIPFLILKIERFYLILAIIMKFLISVIYCAIYCQVVLQQHTYFQLNFLKLEYMWWSVMGCIAPRGSFSITSGLLGKEEVKQIQNDWQVFIFSFIFSC